MPEAIRGLERQSSPTNSTSLTFTPASEIDARKKEQGAELLNNVYITSLTGFINANWETAKTAKQTVQYEILDDYRRRAGGYTNSKLNEIRGFGGSEIFMMLSNEKARAVEAHIKDVSLPGGGEKAWGVEAGPVVDMPEEEEIQVAQQVMAEAMQLYELQGLQPSAEELYAKAGEMNEKIKKRLQDEANIRAERMEKEIEDQFSEGGFDQAVAECIHDVSTTKACILKGPVIKRKKKLTYSKSNGYKPEVYEAYYLSWERRSPLDIYPLPDATDMQNGGFFDRYNLSVKALNSLRGTKGVDDQALNMVIEQYGRSGYKAVEFGDNERSILEQRPYSNWAGYSTNIEALLFWGDIPGFLLQEYGLEVENKYETYAVNVWYVGGHVIKATINEDPLGRRPYSKTSFEKLPGSFWGRGPIELIADYQDICNATARALVNNMGMASGPQVVLNDTSRLPEGMSPEQMYPWKIWEFGPDKLGATSYRPPMEFYQPNPMVDMLLKTYEYFSNEADGVIGMPSYPMGELSGAAKSTASGMSMALGQATKGLKSVLTNIDIDFFEDNVERTYDFNMIHNPNENIKGDLNPVGRGAKSMFVKESQQMRRQEFLDRTNNPTDMAIIGLEGRAELLRGVAKALDLDVDKIIPSDEQQLRQHLMDQQQQQMQAAQQQPGSSSNLDSAGNPAGGQDAALF